MKAFRSVLAVIGGFALVFVLSTATDAILEAVGVFPPPAQQMKMGMTGGLLLLALAYRMLYTVVGGALTAWLSPRRPLLHAVILGTIGTFAALTGAIIMWSLGSQWYSILLTVTALPCTALGGWLVRKKSQKDVIPSSLEKRIHGRR